MARAPLVKLHLIRRLGAVEYVAARDDSGDARLAVAAAPGMEGAEVDALLERIEVAHREIVHPKVARFVDRTRIDGRPCVSLDSAAVSDLEALARAAFAAKLPIDIAGAAAFSIAFVEMLAAVHELTGASAAPWCLGAVSAANVLVAADGSYSIFGWGHPCDAARRARLLSELPQAFVAPEVSLGRAPVAGSDLAAAVAFFHSFLYLGELPQPILRALEGEGSPGLEDLGDRVRALMQTSHGPNPEARSIPRFLELYREVLGALSIVPDERAFSTTLSRALDLVDRPRASGVAIEVSRDGGFFRFDGGSLVDLSRRASHRFLLAALARHRLEAPGVALSWQELFDIGWRGRRAQAEAARSSVYVAVASLRQAGLREVLKTEGTGYLLDPEIALTWLEHRPR